MAGAAADDAASGLPDAVRVPDDASALEPDRLAWLAQERSRRRRARLRRLVLTRRWERFGLSGPLLVLCLVAAAGVGALSVIFVPRPATAPPGPAVLSSAPAMAVASTMPTVGQPAVEPAEAGRIGLRLPDVALSADVAGVRTPALRPAAILLIPPDCRCAAAVSAVYRQAREFRLPVWLLAGGGTGSGAADLVQLDESAAAGGARWAVDPAGVLDRTLATHGLTLALVRADGVLTGLLRDVPLDPAALPALETALAALPAAR